MSAIYVIGIIEQRNERPVCRVISRGSGQECWFLMSLFQDDDDVYYFILPEKVFQKLPWEYSEILKN